MLYRIKQFFWGLVSKLSDDDKYLINKYLDDYEIKLFYMLPGHEQVHSIKVAKEVIYECKSKGINDKYLIKAAFLHDIGKIGSGLNIINKSILVILNKFIPKFLLKLVKFKSVNAYYNHPEIALEYLKNENDKIKYYILNHHNYNLKQDEKIKIIQNADSNY
jgi:putative nucleotidyltransferase with HDIG domain